MVASGKPRQPSDYQYDATAKIADLLVTLDQHIKDWRCQQHRSSQMRTFLSLLSLVLSFGVTIAGLLNQGTVSAALGALIFLDVAVLNLFAFSKRILHYRKLAVAGERLSLTISKGDNSAESLAKYIDGYSALIDMELEEPSGDEVDAGVLSRGFGH